MSQNNLCLAGKSALVTGGSRSIGAAIVRRLAGDGAAVALTFSGSNDKAEALAREIEAAGGRALTVQADAGDLAAVRAAVAQVTDAFGGLDILVNDAGISLGGPIEQVSFEDYQRMIAVNVAGVFVPTHEEVRRMQTGGRVIHIGSSMARYAVFGASVRTLTKRAVAGFNLSLARDLGPRGITVNTVMPGPTASDMNPANGPIAALVGPGIAVQRYGGGEDIANAEAYLASPQASFVSCAELMVDRGFTA